MTFERKVSIIERVPAHKYVCEKCGRDSFQKPEPHNCSDGFTKKSGRIKSRWHGAVRIGDFTGEHFIHSKDATVGWIAVTKSTFLVREWGVCKQCHGTGAQNPCDTTCDICKCVHCHKDADGKPSGAEPDTAGPWRVR